MTENVAAAMPRLERLRQETDGYVSLTMTVDLHRSAAPEVMWEVYVAKSERSFFKGITMDDALKAAEAYRPDSRAASVPDAVILPVCGDAR